MTTRAAAEEGEPYGVFKLEYDISNDDAAQVRGAGRTPIVVAVSGAAGQISEPPAVQDRLRRGVRPGPARGILQPPRLRALASEALEGVAMELEDSLYPLLREVNIGIDPS